MKDAQKPDHVSLNTLIQRLREGWYVVPDFQREFEWRPWDLRDLMRSIFLDYYIGSLLLWKGTAKNFEALSCEPLYGCPVEDPHKWQYIVLDGQQRLTAMYYAFLAPDEKLPNRNSRFFYFIRADRLMREEYDEAFGYDRVTRYWSRILSDDKAQYRDHIFPLRVIGTGGFALYRWIQGYEEHWKAQRANAESEGEEKDARTAAIHQESAQKFGELLLGIVEQYQISYIELAQELEIGKVCDIFTQINSKGVRLDVFDLMNALLKPKDLQLKALWREASPRLDFAGTERMNVYILQVMSILRQDYCSPKYLYYLLPGEEKQRRDPDGTRRTEVLIQDVAEFRALWNGAVDALDGAIQLVRHPHEFGVISADYLPYVSILPVFSALQSHLKSLPPPRRLEGQRKIRHWYWASVFTNRYSGSVESTAARDFIDVKAWIDNDDSAPALLEEFRSRFRDLDLRKETKRGTSIYNGIFNLLVLQGARDWISGNVPLPGDLDDHHIVPQSKAKEFGGSLVNSILNRTPLTADTNRKTIRERLPNAYLPELIRDNGRSAVVALMESHFVSPLALDILLRDPFTRNDFDEFLDERRRTLLAAIENLLVKDRLQLPPDLRQLDQRVETVELALRSRIAKTLGDMDGLPPHVAQKVALRIEAAARKSAGVEDLHEAPLLRKLEFADLRELQDAIMSKATWPRFEAIFPSKEALDTKFDQLAELRNGIRHSRTVGEIARKEGEASILWFEKVLAPLND